MHPCLPPHCHGHQVLEFRQLSGSAFPGLTHSQTVSFWPPYPNCPPRDADDGPHYGGAPWGMMLRPQTSSMWSWGGDVTGLLLSISLFVSVCNGGAKSLCSPLAHFSQGWSRRDSNCDDVQWTSARRSSQEGQILHLHRVDKAEYISSVALLNSKPAHYV